MDVVERVMELAGRPRRTIVYLTPGQVRAVRTRFSLLEWVHLMERSVRSASRDSLDVIQIGNVTVRYKEAQPADPPVVDLTECE